MLRSPERDAICIGLREVSEGLVALARREESERGAVAVADDALAAAVKLGAIEAVSVKPMRASVRKDIEKTFKRTSPILV
jgi:hypothetical protein